MKKPCPNPCNDCPFRKNSVPGWLGPFDGPVELHQTIMSEASFACHLTITNPDDEEEHREPEDMTMCKGAILYMHKACKWPRFNPEVVDAYEASNGENLDNILGLKEFITHHAR